MVASPSQIDTRPSHPLLNVSYEGAGNLSAGHAVCYDWDNSTADSRYNLVEQPSLNNIDHPAGVVSIAVTGTGSTQNIQIIPWSEVINGLDVFSDENCVGGEILGMIPGSHIWGHYVMGPAAFGITQTVDRSGDGGLVRGTLNPHLVNSQAMKLRRTYFFDEFIGEYSQDAVADVGCTWLRAGSDTETFSYSNVAGVGAAAAFQARGVLILTGVTANFIVSIQLHGASFWLSAGTNLWMRIRLAHSSIGSGESWYAGFALPGTTAPVGTSGTDIAGFFSTTTAIVGEYGKDITTGAQPVGDATTVASVATAAADEFDDLFMLIRNPVDGSESVTVYADEVAISHTSVPADVPDNEELTFIYENDSDSTNIAYIDKIEIGNYIGAL